MIIQPDLAVGQDLGVPGQITKLRKPIVFHMPDFVWVNTHCGVHERVAVGERDGCPAGGQVASDRDKCVNPSLLRPCDDGLPVTVKSAVIQMGVGINQHW